jgi:hypothetical protein
MKKILMFVAALLITGFTPASAQVTFGTFYSSLGHHGEWIAVGGGGYVWHPVGVASGWRPYYDGRWIWTDDGWYWDTSEPWGWATYHYGRWYYDDYYGWVWTPGYDWAPAWVEWRYGADCVGWAPLGPYAVFSVGWGIHYRRYWSTPHTWWAFTDCRYMGTPELRRHIYGTRENTRLIGRTRTTGSVRFENGRTVTRGPEREYVEQRGGVRIPRADLVDVRERGQIGVVREGDRERISVYRPRITEDRAGDVRERPERVRTDDRAVSLDLRGSDVRRNEGGRDMRRAEGLSRDQRTYDRSRADGNRIQPDRERAVPNRSADTRNPGAVALPRPDRRSERVQERSAGKAAPAQRERSYSVPRGERPAARVAPNRGSSNRAPAARPERSGGNRGGGRRGERK